MKHSAQAIMLLAALCCADGTIPIWLTMLNLTSHAVYLQNFSKTWPLISLKSPSFIASCVLCIANHFGHFKHFSEQSRLAHSHHMGRYKSTWTSVPTLTTLEIGTFFAIIW